MQVMLELKGAACGPEISFSTSIFSFGSVPLSGKETRILQVGGPGVNQNTTPWIRAQMQPCQQLVLGE